MALGLGHASASEVRRIEKAVCSLVQSFDCRSFDRFSEKRYGRFCKRSLACVRNPSPNEPSSPIRFAPADSCTATLSVRSPHSALNIMSICCREGASSPLETTSAVPLAPLLSRAVKSPSMPGNRWDLPAVLSGGRNTRATTFKVEERDGESLAAFLTPPLKLGEALGQGQPSSRSEYPSPVFASPRTRHASKQPLRQD